MPKSRDFETDIAATYSYLYSSHGNLFLPPKEVEAELMSFYRDAERYLAGKNDKIDGFIKNNYESLPYAIIGPMRQYMRKELTKRQAQSRLFDNKMKTYAFLDHQESEYQLGSGGISISSMMLPKFKEDGLLPADYALEIESFHKIFVSKGLIRFNMDFFNIFNDVYEKSLDHKISTLAQAYKDKSTRTLGFEEFAGMHVAANVGSMLAYKYICSCNPEVDDSYVVENDRLEPYAERLRSELHENPGGFYIASRNIFNAALRKPAETRTFIN